MAPTSAAAMHIVPANDHRSTGPDSVADGPHLGGAGGSDGRVHLQVLTFLTEAGGAEEVAHRAVASLGLLPEVAWAELDDHAPDGPGQTHIALTEHLALRVCMTHSDDAVARSMVDGLLLLVRSVYTKERELERLRAEACTDPLTGLWNRRGFDPFLDQALARSSRTGEHIAVMLCDIDHFKAINDGYGHEAGDRALAAISSVVQQVTRPTDMAARLGGDEIAILLAGADARGASVVAQRLREALADANPLTHPLTMSIGIADASVLSSAPGAPPAPEQLLRLADQALYRAKTQGRDRVVCCEPEAVPEAIEDEITETIVLRSA